jgi:hypothetical protein
MRLSDAVLNVTVVKDVAIGNDWNAQSLSTPNSQHNLWLLQIEMMRCLLDLSDCFPVSQTCFDALLLSSSSMNCQQLQ